MSNLDRSDLAAFVRRTWPEITAEHIAFIDEGWDYRIAFVDDAVVFRLPRTTDHARRLFVDIRLLDVLQERLPIAIPTPSFVASDPPMMGYPKIPGTSIEPHDLGARPSEARRLGRFLDALHRVPVELATRLGAPAPDFVAWRDEWRRRWGWYRKALPLLPHALRERAEHKYKEFIADDRNFEFDPAFVHHDLGPWNIMWDRDHISGVIDWSDSQIGDPAIDFAWISMLPKPIVDATLGEYSARPLTGLIDRALFFEWAGAWSEAAHGLEVDDPSGIDMGVAKLLLQLE